MHISITDYYCIVVLLRLSKLTAKNSCVVFQYGGNPVSCAIAIAVMTAVDEERMVDNAKDVGGYLLSELENMQRKFPDVIGDVRGVGLFVGVELIKDPKTKTPATAETRDVVDR